MTDVFFTATKRALNNITSNYDMVWPTAVGLSSLLRALIPVLKVLCGVISPFENITR